MPKYGLRELEASLIKQVANNEFFKSLLNSSPSTSTTPQFYVEPFKFVTEHNKQAKTFTFTGSGADKCVVICAR